LYVLKKVVQISCAGLLRQFTLCKYHYWPEKQTSSEWAWLYEQRYAL